jgi:hypothetical protein
MPHIPQNVRLLVQKNEAHAQAERHCKDLQLGASVSRWHERALRQTGAAGATTDRLALKAEQEQQASEGRQQPAAVLQPARAALSSRPCSLPPGIADRGGQAGAAGEAGGAVPPGGAAVRGGAERAGHGAGQAEGLMMSSVGDWQPGGDDAPVGWDCRVGSRRWPAGRRFPGRRGPVLRAAGFKAARLPPTSSCRPTPLSSDPGQQTPRHEYTPTVILTMRLPELRGCWCTCRRCVTRVWYPSSVSVDTGYVQNASKPQLSPASAYLHSMLYTSAAVAQGPGRPHASAGAPGGRGAVVHGAPHPAPRRLLRLPPPPPPPPLPPPPPPRRLTSCAAAWSWGSPGRRASSWRRRLGSRRPPPGGRRPS